jgi:hypothetical protein
MIKAVYAMIDKKGGKDGCDQEDFVSYGFQRTFHGRDQGGQ